MRMDRGNDSLECEGFVDVREHYFLHLFVARKEWMASIFGILCREGTVAQAHLRMIIHIYQSGAQGIFPDEFVQRDYVLGRFGFLVPEESVAREYGSDHRGDAVHSGKFTHGLDLGYDVLMKDLSVVARDVIGSGIDYHYLWLEGNHIALETAKHLGGALSAYASADEVVVIEEIRVAGKPELSDGIAHKYNFRA